VTTEDTPDPQTFFTERLPSQWNRALAQQEQQVKAAQKTLDGMRAVDATLRVIVDGTPYDLNIAGGQMSAAPAAGPPLLTLVLDRAGYARLVREAGESAMGFLGGLAGLAGEMKLTKSRLENLRNVQGALRFEVAGPDGLALTTHFGSNPIPEAPDTTLSVDADTYAELRAGRLDPQQAFLGGKIRVAGNMQLAMQVALAALSPD
jgi:hypothetical protein